MTKSCYFQQLKNYVKAIAKLSLPITTSFLAMGIMGVVDTMIVGNYNTIQLAYIGLANSIFVILFTIPIGLLNGVMIKSSQKFGARKFQSCGKIYNEGRKYALLLGMIFLLIGMNGVAIMTIATNGSFSAVNTFAGWLGEETMAIFVIMVNISTMIFMLCFSIGQATSIVVASAYGRKDYKGILIATNAGYVIELTVILSLITLVYHFPHAIFGIFTQDPQILSVVGDLIVYVLIDVFIDALPLNINAALNGQGDVKIPTIFQIVSFLGVRVSACYLLAFSLGWGLKGLILGLACGGACSFVLNSCRFVILARRNRQKALAL